ncbi:menaquinone-dependent protoporphyrinogen oxidase [Actinoplanes tereljensis]|uniref:Flavodoxin n=1 Tax=Paractinoplanes tereljensis TaxID=571912 RepID=A0A919NTQ9_9ACTN|nr:flavodoxin domain-containing protein [Actinoplanes tereljensis]GIF23367.1 flavodoxin [Actinoplanes tereljensis]
MRVLVAYGTTGGGTGEIAAWIADELQAAGLTVSLVPAGEVTGVAEYDAVILGSALYAYGWHADARRFVQRFSQRLTGRPVWLFSSGPLDVSADTGPVPPVRHAETALRELGAREHQTFGGRMTTDAHGWLGHVARQLAREGHAGDFRNPGRVRAWARGLADEITAS